MEKFRLSSAYSIKLNGDNNSNGKDKTFSDIQHHLLEDECPSNYLNDLSHRKIFQDIPFSMLKKLKETMQSPIHHPEGNVWNHTMLVVDEAAKVRDKVKNPEVFMWAALLHDIGKPDTTRFRKGKITAYDHDRVGAELAKKFLGYFTCEDVFLNEVVNLIRWHMHILYILKDLPFAKINEMVNQVDIDELALLGFCDRLGRFNVNRQEEEENVKLFLEKCRKIKKSITTK